MKIFIQLVLANIKETVRDRMQLFWSFVFPIIFVVIFGTIFSGEGNNLNFNVGLVNLDNGMVSTQIKNTFKSIKAFKVYEGTKEEEMDALMKGKRSLVIVFPKNFSEKVLNGVKVDIPVYYDDSKMENSQVLLSAVDHVFNELERQITKRPHIFEVNSQGIRAEKLNQINYYIPGILAMTLMQLGLFGSLRMVELKEKRILRSLGATPLSKNVFVGSEIFVRLILSMVQAMLIITVGHIFYNLKVVSSWFYLLMWILLGAVTFIAMGYALVSFVRTIESAEAIIQVVQFVMMFTAGIFIPLEIMPRFLQPIVKFVPLTYLADSMRYVISGVPSVFGIVWDLIILIIWFIISFMLAMRFKWD